jgi:hypothetical protein
VGHVKKRMDLDSPTSLHFWLSEMLMSKHEAATVLSLLSSSPATSRDCPQYSQRRLPVCIVSNRLG